FALRPYLIGSFAALLLCSTLLVGAVYPRGDKQQLAEYPELNHLVNDIGALARALDSKTTQDGEDRQGQGAHILAPIFQKPATSATKGPKATQRGTDLPLPAGDGRRPSANQSDAHRRTLLWQPVVFAADGTAQVSFVVPEGVKVCRVRVEGHSAS